MHAPTRPTSHTTGEAVFSAATTRKRGESDAKENKLWKSRALELEELTNREMSRLRRTKCKQRRGSKKTKGKRRENLFGRNRNPIGRWSFVAVFGIKLPVLRNLENPLTVVGSTPSPKSLIPWGDPGPARVQEGTTPLAKEGTKGTDLPGSSVRIVQLVGTRLATVGQQRIVCLYFNVYFNAKFWQKDRKGLSNPVVNFTRSKRTDSKSKSPQCRDSVRDPLTHCNRGGTPVVGVNCEDAGEVRISLSAVLALGHGYCSLAPEKSFCRWQPARRDKGDG
ncbi:hypothetical protein WH47_09577 [Habropoda laboriosa]|uniref:Uncharacterized protein n=1 Tax=Habropoda laboriosa TaxID=597456 RepID=A0A0L7RDY5_9HYME|nr:hypothetical protein WH47_09577 [Habropoda laboriosa]